MTGVLKIHGIPLSNATMRVLAVAYEKELDFELVPVDMKTGEHKSEKFLSLNPFGQIPVFEDGDLKLFESRAINQYIANEYQEKGTKLISPGSSKSMALISVWSEVESNQFDPVSSKLVLEHFYKPFFGRTLDPAAVEENETKLAKVLDVYEARLSRSKYLASDCITLADLHHLPNIHILLGTPTKKLFDARPHVSAWIADITSRPAWAKVVALQKH